MEIITYALLLLSSFFGLIIGYIISNIAVEEITQASRYLRYLNIALAPLIFLVASYKINLIYSVIFSLILIIALIFFRNKYDDAWTYSGMGALLFISTISDEALNTSIIIFIYGISIATIQASNHYKIKLNGQIKQSEKIGLIRKILTRYSYYLLIGIIFFAIFTFVL